MIVLGITGGVGSGKSRVLYELKEAYDAYIIEADKLAHTLMQPGETIYNAVVEAFGEEILCDEAPYEIDRRKLGEIVFNDEVKLKLLNSLSHPLVKAHILNEIKQAKEKGNVSLFVIEAALLIEDGYREICDELWYIWVSKETRIERLMAQRGYTREKCISIMESQSPDSFYKENTDCTIDNEKDYIFSSKQIKARLNKLL